MTKGLSVFLLLGLALPTFATTATFYSGSDTGCFNAGLSNGCTMSSSESTMGISLGQPAIAFTPGSTFSAPAAGGVVDLGAFTAGYSLAGVEAGTFDIDVMFTQPVGSGSQTFTADTIGFVSFFGGGALVSFNQPTTQVYSYPGGSFDLSLPTSMITIAEGQTVQLDATITPTPEPALAPMVGGALVLMGFIGRRRFAAKQNS